MFVFIAIAVVVLDASTSLPKRMDNSCNASTTLLAATSRDACAKNKASPSDGSKLCNERNEALVKASASRALSAFSARIGLIHCTILFSMVMNGSCAFNVLDIIFDNFFDTMY